MTLLNEGIYTYDSVRGEWILVDQSSFIVTLNPGGGSFTEDAAPKIKILHAYTRDSSGDLVDVTETAVNQYYRDYNDFFVVLTADDMVMLT